MTSHRKILLDEMKRLRIRVAQLERERDQALRAAALATTAKEEMYEWVMAEKESVEERVKLHSKKIAQLEAAAKLREMYGGD